MFLMDGRLCASTSCSGYDHDNIFLFALLPILKNFSAAGKSIIKYRNTTCVFPKIRYNGPRSDFKGRKM